MPFSAFGKRGKGKVKQNVIRRLLIFLKPYRAYLVLALLAAAASVAMSLWAPVA